jgi:hypothetical protein
MLLTIPPNINAAGLIPFLAHLGSVPENEPEIMLDFSALRRVSPAGIVALVATIKHWQGVRPRRVRFQGLEQCAICDYLKRMDVFRNCAVELPEAFQRHPADGRFVPVQAIEDVGLMSSEIAGCLAPGGEDYDHPQSPLYDLAAYVLGELGANVRQHSRGVGFVAAQTSSREGMVRLAVADNGHGMRQSFVDAGLSWSFEMSDSAALRKALEPRISSKGEPVNQGVGLTLVTGLARLTHAWVLIASGTGLLQMDPTGVVTESVLPGASHHRGTLIALTFRRDKLQVFSTLLDEAKQGAGLLAKRPIKTTFT